MSPRHLRWAAAALVVAVILWLVSERTATDRDDRELGRVLPVSVEGVDRIVFTAPDDTVTLTRTESAWVVNGHAIDNTHLATLFTALQDSAASEVVATSTAVHTRMGVDGSGTNVTFFQGLKQVAVVLFGRRGADRSTFYARVDGDDTVYLYGGPLTGLLTFGVNEWRNKTIVDVPVESIATVAIDRAGSEYSLTREHGRWELSSGAPVDTATVARFLSQFHPLEATRIAYDYQVDSADFRTPERRLTLLDAAGDTIAALVYDSIGDTGFVIRVRGDETVYHVPPWNVDPVMPVESHFHAAD